MYCVCWQLLIKGLPSQKNGCLSRVWEYDRLISLEGKTLDNENEILEYDMDTSDIRKNLISGSVGIQLEYNITDRWSLMTSATHTYSLNNIYSNGRQLRATYLRGGIIYNM